MMCVVWSTTLNFPTYPYSFYLEQAQDTIKIVLCYGAAYSWKEIAGTGIITTWPHQDASDEPR